MSLHSPISTPLERRLEQIMPSVRDDLRNELHTWVRLLQDGHLPFGGKNLPKGVVRLSAEDRISKRKLQGGLEDGVDDPETIICMCQKARPADQMPVRKTKAGVIYRDNVCPECDKTYKDMCALVCPVCKRTRIRMPPEKDALGFVFERGGVYHLDGCICCSGKQESKIIEKVLYDRRISASLLKT